MTMQTWQPQMTEHPHPAGYDGVKASLDAVVSRIREGRKHPMVRSWAGKRLVEAGNPKGHIARAKALFDAMKRQNIWVPDPRGVEYMAGAHLVLGDGDESPMMPAVDCDELVLSYLAACESVGVPTAVVGAAYDRDGNISHVLGMVTDEKGAWYYADPSTEYPFGEAHKATYEEVIDVASGKRICTASSCSVPLQGTKLDTQPVWSFVGVNGIPEAGMVGETGPQVLTDEQKAQLRGLSAQMGFTWDGAVSAYHMMKDVFAELGLPPPGDAGHKVWTPEVDQSIRDVQGMVAIARTALDEGAAGMREVGLAVWESGPLTGVADLFIGKVAADSFYVGLDGQARPTIFSTSNGQPVHPSNAVSGWPLVVGLGIAGTAIISWAVAFAIDSSASSQTKQAEIAAQAARNKREIEAVTSGAMTPEQLEKLRRADALIAEYQAKKADAENKNPIKGAGEGVGAAASGVGDMLKGAALLALVGGGIYLAVQATKGR